jgi:predicted MarR family transcription regulator
LAFSYSAITPCTWVSRLRVVGGQPRGVGEGDGGRQATYDLRRLKRKGLIARLPGHHRYQLTPLGHRVAVLFTKVYGRVLAPGLAELDPRLPTDLAHRSELARAWRQLDRELNQFTNAALTAA